MLVDDLKRLRDKRGMTIQDIAQISGVPESTVKRIFNGSTDSPAFKSVCDIIIAMGGSVDEIIGIKPVTQDDAVYISQELISSYHRHINDKDTVIRDKSRWMRVFFVVLCLLMLFIMFVLVFDIINRNLGYIRY